MSAALLGALRRRSPVGRHRGRHAGLHGLGRGDRLARLPLRHRGTYFALLTIAFAEFTRIGFDHFGWVGGSGGFFLKVVQHGDGPGEPARRR
jgi:hypothetical protein